MKVHCWRGCGQRIPMGPEQMKHDKECPNNGLTKLIAAHTNKPCVTPRTADDLEMLERAEVNERRIVEVLAIPQRAWDERDADSAEARSARSFNHALAIAWSILKPTDALSLQGEGQAGRGR